MKKSIFAIGFAFLLNACTYAISPDLARQADKNITFDQFDADPELYKGKLFILGGTIENSNNIKDGTLIEVSQKPLDRWGKPIAKRESGGRFIVRYPGYLNVLAYGSGRHITVAGIAEGVRKGQEGDYSYPVILSKELKLWPRELQNWNRPAHLDPLLQDPYSSPRRYD